MTAPPLTGIEAVDRVLEERAPFDSRDEAETMAAQLLRVWRALQPGSRDLTMLRSRRQVQRRK
jgi:hypothetical protein